MKCKECKLFQTINNTEETGRGICGYGYDWQPTTTETDCPLNPLPYTCGDCMHYIEHDAACMTVEATDSAYHSNGNLCCGFEDKNYYKVVDTLIEWRLHGVNINDMIARAIEEANQMNLPEAKDD